MEQNKEKEEKEIKPAEVAIDRQKDFYIKDEVYCNWYQCPSCKSSHIQDVDNYCSNCGCKFEWSGTYE